LAQKPEALREYANREGYEVLEEVSDPRHIRSRPRAAKHGPGEGSGGRWRCLGSARLEVRQVRPGAGVSVFYLREEFIEHGTKSGPSTTVATGPPRRS
jgi:hypothetical protein